VFTGFKGRPFVTCTLSPLSRLLSYNTRPMTLFSVFIAKVSLETDGRTLSSSIPTEIVFVVIVFVCCVWGQSEMRVVTSLELGGPRILLEFWMAVLKVVSRNNNNKETNNNKSSSSRIINRLMKKSSSGFRKTSLPVRFLKCF
jgi:hypothetical protein